jgi:hypothetical protein
VDSESAGDVFSCAVAVSAEGSVETLAPTEGARSQGDVGSWRGG